jgi:hypothetical protein
MDERLRKQIGDAFTDLIREHGFRMLVESYSPEHFGNAVVVLEGEEYSVRVVRDRFEMFVDLASPTDPGNWHSVERVLAALDGTDEPQKPFPLVDAAELVAANHERLASHLACDRYPAIKRQIDRLGEAAKQRLLSRVQPPLRSKPE